MNWSRDGWISLGAGGPEPMNGALLLLAVLFVLATILGAASGRRRRRGPKGQRPWRRGGAPAVSFRHPGARAVRDPFEMAAEQMRVVAESAFERKPLLNRQEARLLPILERIVREAGQGHRVMAQTSLGEVIRPGRGAPEEAMAAINSKRLDFAVVDRDGLIVCAVEYQGSGHWQGAAIARDAVKREALRKAGVRVVEAHSDVTEDFLRRALADLWGGNGSWPGNRGDGKAAGP